MVTNKQIQKRNLTHESALERNKFYSIFRKTQSIKEGENLQIADITSTEIKLVDSLDKIFVFLKEVRRLDGVNMQYSPEFENWEFLIKWHKLTIDEKNKLYDEYQSNELNLFIYFRDPAYFETYTKSYISNKIEQDFIDKFLLNDKLYMYQQASIENLDRLNTLEQVLLVIYFAEIAYLKDQATQIAYYLEQKSKLIQQDRKLYKALFDTVLSARTGEESFQPQSLVQVVAQPVIEQVGGQFSTTLSVNYQQVSVMQDMPQQQLNKREGSLYPHQTHIPKNKTFLDRLFGDEGDEESSGAKKMDAEFQPEKEGNFYYNARAQQQVQAYKKVDNTKEFGERHYYQGQNIDDTVNLVSINKFWVDFGVFKENFISLNRNYSNFGLNRFAQSQAPDNQFKQFQGKGVWINSQGTLILFTQMIDSHVQNNFSNSEYIFKFEIIQPTDKSGFIDQISLALAAIVILAGVIITVLLFKQHRLKRNKKNRIITSLN